MNTFFTEHLQTTASESWRFSDLQLYEKENPAQVLSCVIYKFFKNTYFEEHLQTTASETCLFTWAVLSDTIQFWLKLLPML